MRLRTASGPWPVWAPSTIDVEGAEGCDDRVDRLAGEDRLADAAVAAHEDAGLPGSAGLQHAPEALHEVAEQRLAVREERVGPGSCPAGSRRSGWAAGGVSSRRSPGPGLGHRRLRTATRAIKHRGAPADRAAPWHAWSGLHTPGRAPRCRPHDFLPCARRAHGAPLSTRLRLLLPGRSPRARRPPARASGASGTGASVASSSTSGNVASGTGTGGGPSASACRVSSARPPSASRGRGPATPSREPARGGGMLVPRSSETKLGRTRTRCPSAGTGGAVDLAGSGRAGLAPSTEAEQILCQGTDLGDAFGDGSDVSRGATTRRSCSTTRPRRTKADRSDPLRARVRRRAAETPSRDGMHLYQVSVGGADHQGRPALPARLEPHGGPHERAVQRRGERGSTTPWPRPTSPAARRPGLPEQRSVCDRHLRRRRLRVLQGCGHRPLGRQHSAPQPMPSTPKRVDVYAP